MSCVLIIFCIIHYGNQVSAVPRSQFFAFGLTNSDFELGDGDDLTASLLFPAPFFFYGEPYNLLGVSSEKQVGHVNLDLYCGLPQLHTPLLP